MTKEKVTLTLDSDRMAELRQLVGSRSLSSAVDVAVAAYVAHIRHLAAVDDWLTEMDQAHGTVPPETLEWAARLIDEWERPAPRRRKAG